MGISEVRVLETHSGLSGLLAESLRTQRAGRAEMVESRAQQTQIWNRGRKTR